MDNQKVNQFKINFDGSRIKTYDKKITGFLNYQLRNEFANKIADPSVKAELSLNKPACLKVKKSLLYVP